MVKCKFVFLLFLALASAALAADKKPKLDAMQEYVTQHGGTEKPFQNEYWDNHREGIYVDVVSGEALFSSGDKFDSGTGWPSFSRPISDHAIKAKDDNSMFMQRTEVKSSGANSHLGHVFNDGPKDKGGLRYCINSAALRFVAKEDMQKQGYGKYLPLFEGKQVSAEPVKAMLPQAKIMAVYFYADWCSNCKILSPKLKAAREAGALDSRQVLFVTLNLTDKTTINQSAMQAGALGIGSFMQKQGSATGYVAVLDANSKKELARFLSSSSAAEIQKKIAELLK